MTAYTQGYNQAVLASHSSRNASTSCTYFLPLVQPHDKILDVGCGPGTITVSLASHVPQGSIVGVDSSEQVIRAASSQEQVPSNCQFKLGDIVQLPFQDDSFDIVHAHQVLLHVTDPIAALKEMKRVCKQGGFVAMREGDWSTTVVFPSDERLERWKTISETLFRNSGSEPNAGRRLIRWAQQAGFVQDRIRYSASTQTYATISHAPWWASVWAQRAQNPDWSQRALEAGLVKSQDEIDQIVQAWNHWGQQPDAVYSILCGEAICFKSACNPM